MPNRKLFHECRIKTRNENSASDPLFHRRPVPPEVSSPAEDPLAAFSCGQVFLPYGWPLPFHGLSSRSAFRSACEASFRERRLRVATFSSALSVPGRRCYLEQKLARGVSFFKSRDLNTPAKTLRLDSNPLVYDDTQAFVRTHFRRPFGQAISSSRRYSEISPVRVGLSTSNRDQSLTFFEFVLSDFDLGACCALKRL